MFCRQCGAQNPDGAFTCSRCGTAVTMNPYQATSIGGQPVGEKPQNYLVQSILVTLCCCIPLGIVGIVFAAQVDSKWNAGDRAGAISAAENAKKFTIIGLVLGVVLNLIVFAIQILAVIGAANAQNGGN